MNETPTIVFIGDVRTALDEVKRLLDLGATQIKLRLETPHLAADSPEIAFLRGCSTLAVRRPSSLLLEAPAPCVAVLHVFDLLRHFTLDTPVRSLRQAAGAASEIPENVLAV